VKINRNFNHEEEAKNHKDFLQVKSRHMPVIKNIFVNCSFWSKTIKKKLSKK